MAIRHHLSGPISVILALGLSAPAMAQRTIGPYWPAYGPGFGAQSNASMASSLRSERRKTADGPSETARFIAQGAAAKLRQGPIDVKIVQQDGPPLSSALVEAAVVDQLAKLGYDVANPSATGGQVAEVQLSRVTLVPEEQKRNPISGETTIGVSNRGSLFGMALAIDLSKPRKALMSTQMRIRIRDRASNAVLWEGRSSLDTREGDKKWPDEAIAARLSATLLDNLAKPGQAREVPFDTP